MFDDFTEAVAAGHEPELISPEGQALSLMAQVLVEVHRRHSRTLQILERVYTEYEKAQLQRHQFQHLNPEPDGLSSLRERLDSEKYVGFLESVNVWFKALNFYHNNALLVLISVITDKRLDVGQRDSSLQEVLLDVMDSYIYYTRSYGTHELEHHPLVTLPFYNPFANNRRDYLALCESLLTAYANNLESSYKLQGAIDRKRFKPKSEAKHVSWFVDRVVEDMSYEQIAMRNGVAVGTAHEQLAGLARRLNFRLP